MDITAGVNRGGEAWLASSGKSDMRRALYDRPLGVVAVVHLMVSFIDASLAVAFVFAAYHGHLSALWDIDIKQFAFNKSVADIGVLAAVRCVITTYIILSERIEVWSTGTTLVVWTTQTASAAYGIPKALLLERSNPYVTVLALVGVIGPVSSLVLLFVAQALLRRLGRNNQTQRKQHQRSLAGFDQEPLLAQMHDDDIDLSSAAGSLESIPVGNEEDGVSLRRLLALAKPECLMISVGTVALVLAAGFQMVTPHLFGKLIDIVSKRAEDISPGDKRKELTLTALELIAVSTLGSFFTFVRGTLFNTAGERVVARMRSSLFGAIVIKDIAFFDKEQTGDLLNRLASDTTVIQDAVTSNISMGLRWTAQVIVCNAILFLISWKLTLVMLTVIPVLSIGAVIYGRLIRRFSKQYQQSLAAAANIAQESFSNIRTVRSFAMEVKECGKYSEQIKSTYYLGRKKAIGYGLFSGGVGLLGYAAITGVLWYGGILVLDGSMSIGQLTAFMLYTVYIAFALGGLSSLFGSLMNALGASEKVFHLWDERPALDIRRQGLKPATYDGRVTFRDVTFTYPARPDVQVLKGMSFEVQPKQKLALVGPSGHGKSTILALIERFYAADGGDVLLDSHKIIDLDHRWIHAHVAMVSQEPVLFGTSIKNNICYGLIETPTLEAIEHAAKLANAHEFISNFPEGYDTKVGERGVRLSGGQKQRLAIARALLVNPRVLLLDEATSALDAESEHLVQDAIEKLMKDRTVIIVAHRLSTVRDANKILVVMEGKIVAEGTHEVLMQESTMYQNLVKRQIQWDGQSDREDSEQ